MQPGKSGSVKSLAPPIRKSHPAPPWLRDRYKTDRPAPIPALIQALRPRQWIKNTACLAALVFSGQLFNWTAQVSALAALVMFCAAAGAVYIINDLSDRESDRRNPKKVNRPIASGALPQWLALVGCFGCLAASGLLAWHLGWACVGLLTSYVVMNLLYSYRLKHAVIADVMVIALGFVIRVLVGVYAIHVRPTAWIVLCMFFLALFLGFAKRRAELAALKHPSASLRPVLALYTVPYLDVLLAMTATMATICYALFTVAAPQKNYSLLITIPPVVYGITRYMLLVMVHGEEAPEEILTRDKGMIAAVAVWISLCVAVLYLGLHLFD